MTKEELIDFYSNGYILQAKYGNFRRIIMNGEPVDENPHLAVWIRRDCIQEFTEMLGLNYLADHPLPCAIVGGGAICITDFDEVCEWFGIDAGEIFPKDECTDTETN